MEKETKKTFIDLLFFIFGGIFEIIKLIVSKTIPFALPAITMIILNKYMGIQIGLLFFPLVTLLGGVAVRNAALNDKKRGGFYGKDFGEEMACIVFLIGIIVGFFVGFAVNIITGGFVALASIITFLVTYLNLVGIDYAFDTKAKEA